MAECIILAGGKSTRMGTNKMLLSYKGHPLIWHTLKSVEPFVSRIIIVTGKYDQEIREALKEEKVTFVCNKDYERGMFSSVLTGVKETQDDFMILPGDCPFIKKETFERVLKGKGDIRYPKCGELEGHPLYISKKYKDELLTFGLDNNLKMFRDKKKCEIIFVEDKNIAMNLNNKLDFYQLPD
jgi:molybdenum cofactor cytidylyltransferase